VTLVAPPAVDARPEQLPDAQTKRGPGVALRRTFRALHNRNYRLFWFGQVISTIGTWMQRTALSWFVLRLTDSPIALGIETTCQTLPVLFLGLFGGVVADRVPKRRLLLLTQGGMLTQATLLTLFTAAGGENLIIIYALSALLGTFNSLDTPARQAFVKELVGPADVPNAIALNSIVFNTARLIGPALGGIAIATFGVTGCFSVNAVSFLGVLVGLVLMRPELFYDVPNPVRGRVLAQIAEGLRYSARTPQIAVVMLLMAVLGMLGYNFTVILPLFAEYVLHSGPVGFGLLTSSMAIGSLTAAVWIAYSGRVSRRTLFVGCIGFTALLGGLALTSNWPTTVMALIALGFFSIIFTATANSRLQLLSPPQLRGRVMSLYALLFMGSTPIGSLIVGTLADYEGVRLALGELSVVCALGVVGALLYVRRHADGDGAVSATG
jgi:MFS family permease